MEDILGFGDWNNKNRMTFGIRIGRVTGQEGGTFQIKVNCMVGIRIGRALPRGGAVSMTAAVVSPAALFVDALVLSKGLWSSSFAFVAGAVSPAARWNINST